MFLEPTEDYPTISPSQISKWMDCRQAWKYSYKDKLRRVHEDRFYMDRGSYTHRLFHYYYQLLQAGFKAGDPIVLDAMDDKIAEDMENITEDSLKMMATALPVFHEFVNTYSPKIDRGITILGVEQEFHVPITTPKNRTVYLHGIIDLVYHSPYGKLRIKDHKTSERSDAWSNSKVAMELQLLFYALSVYLASGEIPEAVEVGMINMAAKPKVRFEVFEATHGTLAIEAFHQELLLIIDLILDEQIYRRYNKDCGRCSYLKICRLDQQGLPTSGVISTEFVKVERKKVNGIESNTSGQPPVDSEDQSLKLNLGGWSVN